MARYKIIKCQKYNNDRVLEREWLEVQYLSTAKTWWFFGKRVWKTFEDETVFFSAPKKFNDIDDAKIFIERCERGDKQNYITREEVCEVLGK